MSVEALNASLNSSTAIDPGMLANDINNEDDALGAAFDRVARDNGAARGDGGRFAATNDDGAAADDLGDNAEAGNDEPLEGGGGEERKAGDPSTPPAEVPLPSSWRGKDDLWAKIPAELKEPLRAHQEELHKTLSQQGQVLSTYRPVVDVFQNYKEYFNGERGSYKPEEAVDYLFNLQRQMDQNPVETLLQIADTYELRPKLAEMFGAAGGGDGGDGNNAVLLARIGQLENTIRSMGDPSKIDQRITQKLTEERQFGEVDQVIGRVSKDMPLYDQIPEPDLVSFIHMSKQKLGGSASHEAVLKRAYDMAINADPDLRAKAAALQTAAAGDPDRVAAARRANATNLRSTSTGKTRELTQEEELGAVYDKHKGN
jgi:hypothetical protein